MMINISWRGWPKFTAQRLQFLKRSKFEANLIHAMDFASVELFSTICQQCMKQPEKKYFKGRLGSIVILNLKFTALIIIKVTTIRIKGYFKINLHERIL